MTRQLLAVLLIVSLLPGGVPAAASAGTDPNPVAAPAALKLAAGPGGLDREPSPSGSFTESLPVRVPAFHGIEPELSLDYDSAGGNSDVGVGWRLAGESRIVRSGRGGGLPRYDGTDGYLLDGEELVVCTAPCVTGGTHEARRQRFERLVFDQQSWTRWRPNGVKSVYTAVPGAVDGYEWLLTSVTDAHGNTVTYTYDCAPTSSPDPPGSASFTCGTGCARSR